MIAPLECERCICGQLLARLVDPPPGRADEAGEDQSLCLGPAFGETLLDE
jgi:hypothetical protein